MWAPTVGRGALAAAARPERRQGRTRTPRHRAARTRKRVFDHDFLASVPREKLM
jgi:hypothetical protein